MVLGDAAMTIHPIWSFLTQAQAKMLLIPLWLSDVDTCCFILDGLRANKDVFESLVAQQCYLVRDGPGADTGMLSGP